MVASLVLLSPLCCCYLSVVVISLLLSPLLLLSLSVVTIYYTPRVRLSKTKRWKLFLTHCVKTAVKMLIIFPQSRDFCFL